MPDKPTAWQNLLKWLNHGSKALSTLVAGASLGLGIYSAVAAKNPDLIGLDWWIVITLIVFNSVFLIGAAIYECIIFVRGKNVRTEKDNLQIELDKKNGEIQLKNDYIGGLLDYSSYVNLEYNKEYNKIDGLYYILQDFIQSVSCVVISQQDEAMYIDTVARNVENYTKQIIKSFNDFIGFVIRELKNIMDAALKQKGFNFTCSIAVKQMNDSYTNTPPSNKMKILTCYRDSEAYVHNKREVGKKVYSLENNTAFLECLQHDYSIKNDLTGVNATYRNENGEFLKYYNCAVVVPLFGLYGDEKRYYGYLACDALRQDKTQLDVFDDEMVKIMRMTASLIGSYFDDHCRLWEYTANCLKEFVANSKINNKQLVKMCSEDNFIKFLYEIKLAQAPSSQNQKKKNKRGRK